MTFGSNDLNTEYLELKEQSSKQLTVSKCHDQVLSSQSNSFGHRTSCQQNLEPDVVHSQSNLRLSESDGILKEAHAIQLLPANPSISQWETMFNHALVLNSRTCCCDESFRTQILSILLHKLDQKQQECFFAMREFNLPAFAKFCESKLSDASSSHLHPAGVVMSDYGEGLTRLPFDVQDQLQVSQPMGDQDMQYDINTNQSGHFESSTNFDQPQSQQQFSQSHHIDELSFDQSMDWQHQPSPPIQYQSQSCQEYSVNSNFNNYYQNVPYRIPRLSSQTTSQQTTSNISHYPKYCDHNKDYSHRVPCVYQYQSEYFDSPPRVFDDRQVWKQPPYFDWQQRRQPSVQYFQNQQSYYSREYSDYSSDYNQMNPYRLHHFPSKSFALNMSQYPYSRYTNNFRNHSNRDPQNHVQFEPVSTNRNPFPANSNTVTNKHCHQNDTNSIQPSPMEVASPKVIQSAMETDVQTLANQKANPEFVSIIDSNNLQSPIKSSSRTTFTKASTDGQHPLIPKIRISLKTFTILNEPKEIEPSPIQSVDGADAAVAMNQKVCFDLKYNLSI